MSTEMLNIATQALLGIDAKFFINYFTGPCQTDVSTNVVVNVLTVYFSSPWHGQVLRCTL